MLSSSMDNANTQPKADKSLAHSFRGFALQSPLRQSVVMQKYVHAQAAHLMADRNKADRMEGTGYCRYPSNNLLPLISF